MSSPSWQEGDHLPRSGASTPEDYANGPRTPRTSTFESPLLSPDSSQPPSARSVTNSHFVSSPLNPKAASIPVRSRPASRGSTYFNRIASEESQALSAPYGSLSANRGSMVLYRLASDGDDDHLAPPKAFKQRDSVISSSGDSIVSLSSDSKYPSASLQRGFVPYAYDPEVDKDAPDDDDDFLHTPEYGHQHAYWSWRGISNISVLVILVGALLTLFICYPVVDFLRNDARNIALDSNIAVNGANGTVFKPTTAFAMPHPVDPDTPDEALTRTGFDGEQYELVFSDEFNEDGRTFNPGDDPFWEAADLWYGATQDMEWYDPKNAYTKDGALQLVLEEVSDPTSNHGLGYRSGMLQSWNKFCFTSGYIEVAVTMPGPNEEANGYWPGAWLMGNLGRPGYGATTDGTWPYSYDTCDVGTFPNQTTFDKSGPEAALHSDESRQNYNYELSWLPGQRLSACTCPGEDHPGPDVKKGRGVPEIDIFEMQHNKTGGGVGNVASQSAQFAPFTHDYLFLEDTDDQHKIYNPAISRNNGYRGSALQQAVSTLTNVPSDMFQGAGAVPHTLGFEYWANPKNRDEGFITWQVDGKPSHRLGAAGMGPDQGTGGSMVGPRLISEEPMSIILNLGISHNWGSILQETLIFPAVMTVDYVRVYQRVGHTNIGCDPPDYPTQDYIRRHPEAYSNANLTKWSSPNDPAGAGYSWPRNGEYQGSC